jgi:hypothetical protein
MNPRNQISDLLEFLQKAIKLAKYNSNTGGGMVNAIRAAERGLLPEEPKDIDYLVSHMEELFFRQKELGLSPQSQAVYFTRIRRAVEDYKKHGLDAKAIYAWSPKLKPKKVTPTAKRSAPSKQDEEETIEERPNGFSKNDGNDPVIREVGGVKLNVVTWRLRPGVLVKIELPEDLNKSDVERIKKLLDLEIETF